MRNWRSAICLLLLAGALLLPATPALADESPPNDDGVVIWNEDYTLGEGENLDGDLVVFSGSAALETDSRVKGAVVIWNGDADVNGTIEEELVVSGGDIHLGDDAWVKGDLVCTWNCDIKREEGSRVDGQIVAGISLRGFRFENWRDSLRIPVPSPPSSFWASGPRRVLEWTLKALRTVVTVLAISAVAGLVALIWPHETAQVGRAVVEAPWPSFGVGLLTAVAATALIIALAITCCFSPIAALGALALGAAGLFGWIAIGTWVGERLLQALDLPENEITPLWVAGLGTLVITLISTGLSAAFCLAPLGWFLTFVLGCLGLGAVVLTRFGTMSYSHHLSTPSRPAQVEAPESTEPPGEGAGDDEAEGV